MTTNTALMLEKGITQEYVNTHEAKGYKDDAQVLTQVLEKIEDLEFEDKLKARQLRDRIKELDRAFAGRKIKDMDRKELEYFAEILTQESIFLYNNLMTTLYLMTLLSIENEDKEIFTQLKLGIYKNNSKVA